MNNHPNGFSETLYQVLSVIVLMEAMDRYAEMVKSANLPGISMDGPSMKELKHDIDDLFFSLAPQSQEAVIAFRTMDRKSLGIWFNDHMRENPIDLDAVADIYARSSPWCWILANGHSQLVNRIMTRRSRKWQAAHNRGNLKAMDTLLLEDMKRLDNSKQN